MEDKSKSSGSLQSDDANNLVSSSVYDGSDQSYNVQALSADPVHMPQDAAPQAKVGRRPKHWLVWSAYAGVALFVLSVAGLLFFNSTKEDNSNLAASNASGRFDAVTLPLDGLDLGQPQDFGGAKAVTINGQLTVDGGLIIVPSLQPSTGQPGQLYYDTNSNTLAFFNGTEFVQVGGSIVEQISGLTGQVALGSGLSAAGGQISNSGVLSVQGQVGDVAFTGGNGIAVNGTTITNTGVVSVASSGPSIVVSDDGNGNITLTQVGGGSGTVSSPGGTAGRIAKFTGAQVVEDSLLSESGATVTVNGNLAVTGSIALSAPLSVASGGSGAATLGANGVLVGNGTSAITSIVAGGAGLCLVSTGGAPSWASCTSSSNAVTSLNGLTGGLTIANATGSVNTITIDDATTSTKGIASFNGTNFTVTSGAVNTAQNISAGSSPTFAGVNTNNITPSGALTVGSSSQALSLLGSDSSIFAVTGGGQSTTVGFSGIPTGAVNYNFDRSAATGTYVICTTAANCAGAGGGVTTSGGTNNFLSKFTGAQTIGNSSLSDDGTTVTVNGTANLLVQGGTGTFGTLTQAGSLVISDGSSNTATIVISGHAANRNYTIPDVGADASFCLSTGNCTSASAPVDAAYLVANLNGTLSDERALAAGSNISLTDGGANANFTVATVQNPTFTTSVTTPLLQSSGVLSLASGAGDTVVINAGTTIELQDSANITGNLDVSGGLNVGTANAFVVDTSGAVTAATGITSSGTITFSSLNCTTFANGGALTTNGSGQLACSDDDGGAGSAISGTGTAGTVALFSAAQTIANSIITQSGTTITIAGDLTLSTALSVANGGTGLTSVTNNGLLYGNGTGQLQVTAAGTSGQVLIANASGAPTFVSIGGDVAVTNAGVVTIQANSVALGTDTVGDYVANLGALTGLSTSGNTGEGSAPTLSVNYGSLANTAVQGNVTLTCPSGGGNLNGGGNTITLGAGGSCNNIGIVDNPAFATSVTTPSMILTGAGSNGTIQVGNLGQGTVYTLPDPGGAAATICLSVGNCTASGTAGGDLTGSYPNPTIAKLQGGNLSITSPTAGNILVYNATNSQWENSAVSGDIAISETGVTTVQANAVALTTDTTGNYVLSLTAGTGTSVTGSAGEGWTPTVSVLYGSSAGTAVEGNTGITVSAGTNLTGGGSITLGSGGSVTLDVASSPTFSGTLVVQGATATVGAAAQQGSVVLNDGSANTGTIQTAALGQNTTFILPDPATGSVSICVSTGNCAGAGGGVTTSGGTTNRVSKFTGSQTIGDSSISDDGTTVTINGTANLVVQGGTGTFGTTTQAGSLVLSDGSSNTVSIVAGNLSANRIYTLPDAGGDAVLCTDGGNCIGGSGSAPNTADYLVASLNGTLTNERALAAGSNISFTDGGANANFTVATVQNPTFTTSVTTPQLQSSGALVISSAAGNTVAIDAGTTIELQDSTNVTGSLDVSVALNVGTLDAFQVNSSGAIAAATGITSSGTIVFSALDCTTFANGGAVTANALGQLSCSDDNGAAGNTITGSGTSGTVALFNGTQTITDSIITQSGTTVTIAGDLTLSTALSVGNGGTGATTFTSRGVLYGNGTGAVQVTAAGASGQVLVANATGVPTFVTFSGDVAVSDAGATTIQANSVALGTDTTGDFVSSLGTLTGLSTSGNTGEGSTPTLSVNYGSLANTAVQGNVTLACPSGAGNLTGGGTSITLGTGGTCANLNTVNNPTFSTSVTSPSFILTGAGSNGTIQVGNLGQGTVYTLPDPAGAAATICISTGNCSAVGAAGGDLTGTYPNPTIASLQGTNLTISGPIGGHVLVYNATNTRWENRAVAGDITLSESGSATIQANAVALTTDTTGNYVLSLTAGTGTSVTGSAGEGWTPTVSVLYGSSAGNAVEGNTSITVTAGTNLTGGGSITLGAGGSVTLDVASSPTFSGTLTVQGATATIGTAAQQGSVVLNDGSANTGTIQTAALGQNTVFTLPDPSAGTATICLSTGNCAGSGSGVTTAGGTTNRISKFTASQAIGDSSVSDDGTTVTINGTANLVVQGGTSTLGTSGQAGTLAVSDGSSNTVSIVVAGLAADRTYTIPEAGGSATFCMSSGNCVGGGGSAPGDAEYLLLSLHGSLTNERALAAGSNISFTDAGANGNLTVATVQNPTFTTSVTTPALQSSGALVISSAAGNTVAVDAGTTIELQDSTNVTGSLDVSVALNVGTLNAFQINSSGAIAAATGIISSGTITFSSLNCTTFANGGALTTNGSGQLACSDDEGASASTITGTGTSGVLPVFSGAQTVIDSIVTQSGTTINIAGDLTLNTDLTVANGGTGAGTFTSNGVLYGAGTGALLATAAGTGGQVLIANATGVPTFATFSGDVAVSDTGVTTIQVNSVALGTDTTGDYVANLGTLTGLSTTGNSGEGSTPTLSVTYGSGANNSVQGNTTLTCPSGSGNLTGGGNSVTLGGGGTCNNLSTVNNPTFTTSVTTPSLIVTGAGSNGTLQVASLGQATAYTLPDPAGASAEICLNSGNCTTAGTAGGDLTGSYPNPTIASLQSTTLTISSVASGNILQYNGSAWVNQSISGDVTLSSGAVATIATGAVTSGKIADGTIANIDLASGSFTNITGVGTLGALTVVGATSINASGTASTTIGNATGTFQLDSSALDITTAGALSGVTGITTSGGYVQSGVTANTLTGATSFTAAGTALSVTNNASVGGTLTVNTITPNSALTVGAASQTFTLQGNATSAITADDLGNTTTVGFTSPTADTTLNFPALAAGTYTLCTSSGNCGGVGATLQTAYANSTNPEIVLDASPGGLTVRDSSGGIGGNLFEVQNNDGSTTYFNVTATGINITGAIAASGNINTTGGVLQTGGVDRIGNTGNLVNIGNLTATGAITIASTGIGSDVVIDGADQFVVQDAAAFNGTVSLTSMGTANTASYLCLNSSNLVAVCDTDIVGTAFIQGGNTFAAAGDLGTNDSFDLNLRTNSATRLTVGAAGGVTLASGNSLTFAGGNSNLIATNAATGTTGTTTGTGANTATLTLTSDAFSVNDIIFIDNAGQDFYTRITADPGTGSYTVSPVVTFETGRAVTKYTAQNIGATSSDYATQANRFFQGYFLGGVVAGLDTTYSDQNITSTGTLRVDSVASPNVYGFRAETIQNGATGFLSGNRLSTTLDPGGTASASYFGNQNVVNIGSTGTTFTGDIIANISQVNWSGASNTSNTGRLYGAVGKVVTSSGAGSVETAVALLGQLQYAVGTSVTNSYNVYASNLQSGSTTNLYGFYAEQMTGGTNNYPLYLASGTANQPLLSVTGTGATVLRNSTDSTAAFQIQNSLGLSGFNIDTTTANVITNPSFETNTTGWAAKGSATLSRITTQYYDNNASLQAATTAASGDGARYAYSLASSTQYSLSVYIKTSSGGSNTFEIGYSNDGSTDTSCSTNIFGETSRWGHYTCTFTTGTTSGSPYIYVKQINAAARNIYIDAVSLEAGATASQYRNIKASLSGGLAVNAGSTTASSTDATLYVQSNGGGDGVVIVGNGDGDIFENAFKVTAADGTTIFNVNETSFGATVQGGSAGLGTPALQIISTSAGARALDIKAASGQTADVFRIKDNGDVTILSVGSTGDVTVQPNANSASAFRILNANASVTLLSANTSSSTVSIGGALTATGNITNGGFDFTLGNTDQSTRGNTGLSRAFVKNTGGVLVINYAGDFTGGVQVQSPLSSSYTTNSTTAFTVIGSGAVERFVVDTTNSRVYIGDPTADSTGALLVLDYKNTTGDPSTTGITGGAMYYNSADAKFRCYENSAWLNCLSGLNSAVTVNDREDASYTANITSFGTTIVSGTYNDTAVVFVAPPSGKVMISYEAEMFNSGTGYTVITPEVRTGGTIGSGTVVHTASDNDNLTQAGTTTGSHSRFIYLSGLTPDSQYNVRLLHRVQSGTGTFLRRQVLVQPVW